MAAILKEEKAADQVLNVYQVSFVDFFPRERKLNIFSLLVWRLANSS